MEKIVLDIERLGLIGYLEKLLTKLGGADFAEMIFSIIASIIPWLILWLIVSWCILPFTIRSIRGRLDGLTAKVVNLSKVVEEQRNIMLRQTELLQKIAGVEEADPEPEAQPKGKKEKHKKGEKAADPEFSARLKEQTDAMKSESQTNVSESSSSKWQQAVEKYKETDK